MDKVFADGFGGVRLSPDLAQSPAALKRGWREWLALYNRVQVLPNTWLLETSGMLHGDYSALAPSLGLARATATIAEDPWRPIKALALEELHTGLDQLMKAGAPLPDHVGYELASDSGEVVAEGELVWEDLRLVVLATHQEGMRAVWELAGWTVINASEPAWSMLVLDRTRSDK